MLSAGRAAQEWPVPVEEIRVRDARRDRDVAIRHHTGIAEASREVLPDLVAAADVEQRSAVDRLGCGQRALFAVETEGGTRVDVAGLFLNAEIHVGERPI